MAPHSATALGAAVCAVFLTWSAMDRAPLDAQASRAAGARTVAAWSFELVKEYARPMDAYTQGLVFQDGRLYEGTGLYGESMLRETVLEHGVQRVVRSRLLPDRQSLPKQQQEFRRRHLTQLNYSPQEIRTGQAGGLVFGEGIAIKDGRIYQLTWVEGLCFVWDISNWNTPARVFHYEGEGWGLTHDGTQLIMSDGSAKLTYRDPRTFAVVRTVNVVDPRTGAPVRELNELEYVDGRIYANIYQTRRIAIIDARSGLVEGYVFFDGQEVPGRHGPLPTLLPRAAWRDLDLRGEVLNGIARGTAAGQFFVTGKKWPAVFEVRLRKILDAM
jgi:glutamine cyclotransferase